jgi:signal peptidase I
VALAVALLIKAFVVQAFFIPSASMENTLRVGDRVLVNKVVYHLRDIQRGDIVVFDGVDSFQAADRGSDSGGDTGGDKDFIKRVIGVAGDRVRCCDAQGRLLVNGVPLAESTYLYPGDEPSDVDFDIEVPPGRLWVMGDHRSDSKDSRAYIGAPGGGFVPTDRVIGRAFSVVWPISHFGTLPIPATFAKRGLSD